MKIYFKKYLPIFNLLKVNSWGFFLNIFQQLLYIPIIVYFSGTSDYASWSVAMATGAFMTLAGLGLVEYFNVYSVQEVKKSSEKKLSNDLLNFYLLLITLSIVLISVIYYFFHLKIDSVLLISFCFYSFLGLLISTLSIYYRAYNDIESYISVSNNFKLFEIVLSSMCLIIYEDIITATKILITIRIILLFSLFYVAIPYFRKLHVNNHFIIDFVWLKKAYLPASGTLGVNVINSITNQYFMLWVIDEYSDNVFTIFNILRISLRFVNKFQNIINYTLYNSYIHKTILTKDALYMDKLSLMFSYLIVTLIIFTIFLVNHFFVIFYLPAEILLLLAFESLYLLLFQKESTRLSSSNNQFKLVFTVLCILFLLLLLHSNNYISAYFIYFVLLIHIIISLIDERKKEKGSNES